MTLFAPIDETPALPISFELFPPKTSEGMAKLCETVQPLRNLCPDYVSVTYGAGGSSRGRTLEAIGALSDIPGFNIAGHLTCAGADREVTLAVADRFADLGVTEIIALRGDPPQNEVAAENPIPDAVALVEELAKTGRFKIRVGCYPEVHPRAASAEADLDVLKAKLDAGADCAITQFFFDIDDWDRFIERCAKAGIDDKIVPGIMPIQTFEGVSRFAERCGTAIPVWLRDAYSHVNTQAEHDLLSLAICTELCDELINRGAPALHFYTLNKPELSVKTCEALKIGKRPSIHALPTPTEIAV
ncbi:methylenetetrahydrofolate reductase [Rhodobacteraceae bacterium NNCM2]|nr:methylenetetrahydrofolate reductase [Coraliihabitans acroporae]